jgi:hypothetical protein
MHSLGVLLDRFESVLFGHVGHVLEVAATSPAGGAGRWEEVLGHFGIEGMPRAERGPAAARRGHARGAFPEEVELVLQAIVAMATASLADLRHVYGGALAADPGAAARVQAMSARLGGLALEQRQAYEAGVRPKPVVGTGVAAIFANAKATAEISPWKSWTNQYQTTLQCPGCGAAQQAELVFTCKYCGGNLFGERGE